MGVVHSRVCGVGRFRLLYRVGFRLGRVFFMTVTSPRISDWRGAQTALRGLEERVIVLEGGTEGLTGSTSIANSRDAERYLNALNERVIALEEGDAGVAGRRQISGLGDCRRAISALDSRVVALEEA